MSSRKNKQRGPASHCVHVKSAKKISFETLLKAKQESCSVCNFAGKSRWLCLKDDCYKVHCGAKANFHSDAHYNQDESHCVQVNIATWKIFCSQCDEQVLPENNKPKWIVGSQFFASEGLRRLETEEFYPESSRSSAFPISVAPDVEENTPLVHKGLSSSEKEVTNEKNEEENDSQEKIFGRFYNDRERPTAVVDEEIYSDEVRGLKGLQNMGNTCYMNAALQCLSNCPPLLEYFLYCPILPSQTPVVSMELCAVLKQLWSDRKQGYVSPFHLLRAVQQVFPTFRTFQQQDSQEFLRCFLDQIHQELRVPVYDWEVREARDLKRQESTDSDEGKTNPNNSGRNSRTESHSSRSDSYETADSGWSSEQEMANSEVMNRRRTLRRRNRSESREFSDARQELSPQLRRHTKSASSALPSRQKKTGNPRKKRAGSPDLQVPKKKPLRYRSMVTEVFDGRLLSSVECLTCNHISETKETFQDLSLPIPNRDQLNRLRSVSSGIGLSDSGIYSQDSINSAGSSQSQSTACPYLNNYWADLHDLGANRLVDIDLAGVVDVLRLRNGLKTCRLLALPEILGIHLKRFRHDIMFSSKISTRVSFPLIDLDLQSFVHENCSTKVSKYDLIGVINHSGGAEGGHYIAYCKNPMNQRWYEFDDCCVSAVSEAQVATVEAYVLFYQKNDTQIENIRINAQRLLSQKKQSSIMKYYVSREWVHKFNTFAEPGPITNSDFLCPHSGISPRIARKVSEFYAEFPAHVWTYLHTKFDGGPVCSNLVYCLPCQQQYKRLELKRMRELDTYRKLDKESRLVPMDLSEIRAISLEWIEAWDKFVHGYQPEPPGVIDNFSLLREAADGRRYLRGGGVTKFLKITRDMWEFFYTAYGGGPEVFYQLGPQPTAEEIAAENRKLAEAERREKARVKEEGSRSSGMSEESVEGEEDEEKNPGRMETSPVDEGAPSVGDAEEEFEEKDPEKVEEASFETEVEEVSEKNLGGMEIGGGKESSAGGEGDEESEKNVGRMESSLEEKETNGEEEAEKNLGRMETFLEEKEEGNGEEESGEVETLPVDEGVFGEVEDEEISKI